MPQAPISGTTDDTRLRHVEHAMGTVFSCARSRGQDRQGAGRARRRRVLAELALSRCDPDVWEVLRLCEDAERRTGGWFSAYCDRPTHRPDADGGPARHSGVFDPTGLVKGWAVERAARMLVSAGAQAVCLNGGGDIQLYGEPWRIGISDPHRPGGLVAVVEGDGELAVAASGPAERGCHILDPNTGEPPATDLASVTVICPGLTDADAWATAAYAMGGRARDWLEELPGAEGFAVTADGGTWYTSGFGRYAAAVRA